MDRLESAGPEKNLGSKFCLFWDFASIICLRWFGWNGRRARRRKRRRKKERRKKTFGDYCLPGLHENVCFREETKINEKQSFPVSDETLTCSSFFLSSFSSLFLILRRKFLRKDFLFMISWMINFLERVVGCRWYIWKVSGLNPLSIFTRYDKCILEGPAAGISLMKKRKNKGYLISQWRLEPVYFGTAAWDATTWATAKALVLPTWIRS